MSEPASPRRALDVVVDALHARGLKVRAVSSGYMAQCPAHDDTNPSLSITHADDRHDGGRVLLHCHAGCEQTEVVEALGLSFADLYDNPLPGGGRGLRRDFPYQSGGGRWIGSMQRFDGIKGKEFRPVTAAAGGQLVRKSSDELKSTPYRLPEVVAAIDRGDKVYVCEGERDADSLAAQGFAATCNANGAGKWTDQHAAWLRGADVIVCRDNDPTGHDHARKVVATLTGVAWRVRVVEPAEGKDVTDHLAAGHSVAELRSVAMETAQPEDAVVELPVGDPSVGQSRAERVVLELERLRVKDEANRLHRQEKSAAVQRPTPILLSEFLARPRRAKQWLVDGLFPAGARVLLAAAYKAGKTTLTGNLVRCLVDGDRFLGEHNVSQLERRVVILDNELDDNMLQGWLDDQGITNTGQVVVVALRGSVSTFDLLDPDTLAEWAELLASYEPGVIILDCLRPVLDALNLDENRDAGRFLVRFDELISRAGADQAVIVDHMGHGAERARGDSRKRDWPDVEWRLVREDADDPASPRYFTAFGRDVDHPERQLAYDIGTRRLSIAGGSRKETQDAAAVPALLELLEEEPGLSVRGVEERLTDSGATTQKGARSTLKLAERQELVHDVPGARGAKLHYLTDKGSASLRRSVSSVRQHGESECVSASIDDALTHTDARTSSASGDAVGPCYRCDQPTSRPADMSGRRLCERHARQAGLDDEDDL